MNTEARTIALGQILEREFRKAADLPIASRVSVEFDDEEEEIRVTVDGVVWTHLHGSEDDDAFMFEDGSGDMVDFEIPEDYLEIGNAADEPNDDPFDADDPAPM